MSIQRRKFSHVFIAVALVYFFYLAVRADRMRGGRNKFGPMYKRDRARKLQIMRQRQLAVQALRAAEGNTSQLSPTGYQQPYSNMPIKQEIQIPQVSIVFEQFFNHCENLSFSQIKPSLVYKPFDPIKTNLFEFEHSNIIEK